jgi:hypothetical protein
VEPVIGPDGLTIDLSHCSEQCGASRQH